MVARTDAAAQALPDPAVGGLLKALLLDRVAAPLEGRVALQSAPATGAGGSGVIHQLGPGQALLTRAVCAAEELSVGLHTVAEDAAQAIDTSRGDLLGSALDAVEDVDHTFRGTYLERHLVVVVADLAHGHGGAPLAAGIDERGTCRPEGAAPLDTSE